MSDKCGKELKNGEKCSRPAGWGTDEDKGYCKDHRDSKNKDLKKKFVQYLKNNLTSMMEASKSINRHESTIWNWRQEDPEFDKKVKEAKQEQKNMRVDRVKDSMFQRIVEGDAAASETIFWLKNNAGWESQPDAQVNIAQKFEGMSIEEKEKKLEEIVES